MTVKLGKIQKRLGRAFAASPGADLATGDLVPWAYPRLAGKVQNKHRYCIRRAAPAVAVEVRRASNRAIVWRAKPPATD